MKDKHDQGQSSQLDEILRDLEARFAGDNPSKHTTKKSRKSFFSSFTQSQIIGGLTLVLLVIGATVGLYLGQTNQELRQQASNVYPQCSNTTGSCGDHSAGSSCTSTLGEVGTCQNSDTNANCTCVPGIATVTPSGEIPNCSADPNCNPSCAGDPTCDKFLCITIVSASSPFPDKCNWGGQIIDFNYCNNLPSCGPVATATPTIVVCTPTGSCTGGSNFCCNSEVPVFNPTLCSSNSRTWCPPAATGIQPTTIPNQTTTPPNQPTNPPGQPTNPPNASPTLIVLIPTNTLRPTNTSVPTTPGAPTNTSVPLPTNTSSPRPTNTSVPVPTNTSVPNNNGGPTNTPVPVPTNTSVPLSTFTPTSSLRPTTSIIAQAPVVSVTATPTRTPTSNPTTASTATTQPVQTQVATQNTALPRAGSANQNVQFILAAISLAVLVGAVVLLFFL